MSYIEEYMSASTATKQRNAVIIGPAVLHGSICCSVSYHAIRYVYVLCHAMLGKHLEDCLMGYKGNMTCAR